MSSSNPLSSPGPLWMILIVLLASPACDDDDHDDESSSKDGGASGESGSHAAKDDEVHADEQDSATSGAVSATGSGDATSGTTTGDPGDALSVAGFWYGPVLESGQVNRHLCLRIDAHPVLGGEAGHANYPDKQCGAYVRYIGQPSAGTHHFSEKLWDMGDGCYNGVFELVETGADQTEWSFRLDWDRPVLRTATLSRVEQCQ